MKNPIKSLIYQIENNKTPLFYFLFSFLLITLLRTFLETFSASLLIEPSQSFHFSLAYFSFFLSLGIFLNLATKNSFTKSFKLLSVGFLVIFIAPIFDIFITPEGPGRFISYFMPAVHQADIFKRFFLLGGESAISGGATLGVKVELVLVLIFSFIYFRIKNINTIKSILYSFIFYTITFLYFSLPIIINIFYKFTQDTYLTAVLNTLYFIVFFQVVYIFYKTKKDYFLAIVKDLRYLRIGHYLTMFVIGLLITILYIRTPDILLAIKITPLSIVNFILVFILVVVFSIITNNLEDVEIDELSNSERPLFKKGINIKEYANLTYYILALILLSAPVIGFINFFLLIVFLGFYFIYSVRPFRLKRVPVFSKLIISINSFIMMLAGYLFIYSPDPEKAHFAMINFPKEFIYYIFFSFLALNFIDIKDYKGDKKAGIKTIPTIFGEKLGKQIIGLFVIVNYLALYIFFSFPDYYIVIFLLLGFTQYYFINRESYDERYVFVIYFITLINIFFHKFLIGLY